MRWSALSKGEKQDVLLVYGGAGILGVGSVLFRAQTVGALPGEVLRMQYALSFVLLGSLLLLRWRSRTASGVVMTTGLSLVMLLGVLVPVPGVELLDAVSYGLLALLVFVGGMLHYRFNQPTNFHAIALAGLMGLETYLFGMGYTVISFLENGDTPFLIAALLMTVVVVGYVRILRRELASSYSEALPWIQ
ncbi:MULTISPECIES: hypothetical protein [Haloarcula]|uniref:hypothetical protein n=1 Tax=Haloarcula TaxID=2237 RepID=UPI0023EB1F32|nr:hypothetical protein [Halomicroarcula sp. XH51]